MIKTNLRSVRLRQILVLISCELLFLWPILGYDLWKDDWINIWLVINKNSVFWHHFIHPATLLEFYFIGNLIQDNSFLWMVEGFILRIISAYAVGYFVRLSTASKTAEFISQILWVITVIGLDAVSWVAPHTVYFCVTFLCLACGNLIQFFQSRNKLYLIISIGLFIFAIGSDPGRAIPIVFIIPFLYAIYCPKDLKIKLKQKIALISTIGVLSIILICIWQYRMLMETVVFKFFSFGTTVPQLISKAYVIANYFASICYLFLGWLIPLPEYLSTGEYHRVYSRIGLCIVCICLYSAYRLLQSKNKAEQSSAIFIVWVLIFYVPQWLVEPRLTMGVTHRYMVIPAVGLIAFLSYMITKTSRYTGFLILGTFFIANFIQNYRFFQSWTPFRSTQIVTSVWKRIINDTMTTKPIMIFSIRGDHPIIAANIHMSGQIPYVVKKRITHKEDFAMMIDSPEDIVPYICKRNYRVGLFDGSEMTIRSIPVTSVYMWSIDTSGNIVNLSDQFRYEVNIAARKTGCII